MGEKQTDPVETAYARTTWGNTTAGPEDWRRMLAGDDGTRKQRLFEHLFLESPDGSDVRNLFSREEIRTHLTRLSRPFPRARDERRRKVWRWLYCDIREPIPELDWRIPPGYDGA